MPGKKGNFGMFWIPGKNKGRHHYHHNNKNMYTYEKKSFPFGTYKNPTSEVPVFMNELTENSNKLNLPKIVRSEDVDNVLKKDESPNDTAKVPIIEEPNVIVIDNNIKSINVNPNEDNHDDIIDDNALEVKPQLLTTDDIDANKDDDSYLEKTEKKDKKHKKSRKRKKGKNKKKNDDEDEDYNECMLDCMSVVLRFCECTIS